MAKQGKSKLKFDAHAGAINLSLVLGAVAAAFAPPIAILAAGGVVSAGMWAGAGLSTLLGLAAGNVKSSKPPAEDSESAE